MYDSLCDRCERAFEDYVEGLSDLKPDELGMITARTPWTSAHCIFQPGIPALIDQIHAALEAQVWFARHGPCWAQPLPLAMKEISSMLRGGGPHFHLASYAFSLHALDYDYMVHPMLYEFCRGVMASPAAPDRVRDDPELRQDYPPSRCRG